MGVKLCGEEVIKITNQRDQKGEVIIQNYTYEDFDFDKDEAKKESPKNKEEANANNKDDINKCNLQKEEDKIKIAPKEEVKNENEPVPSNPNLEKKISNEVKEEIKKDNEEVPLKSEDKVKIEPEKKEEEIKNVEDKIKDVTDENKKDEPKTENKLVSLEDKIVPKENEEKDNQQEKDKVNTDNNKDIVNKEEPIKVNNENLENNKNNQDLVPNKVESQENNAGNIDNNKDICTKSNEPAITDNNEKLDDISADNPQNNNQFILDKIKEKKQEIIQENSNQVTVNKEDELPTLKTKLKSVNKPKIQNQNQNISSNVQVQNKQPIKRPIKEKTNPNIFDIIPEKLLNDCSDNELLFLSDLKKMININVKERVRYSDRFCMITKENFIIYSSKENFITLKKPLVILPLNEITKVILFKLNPKEVSYNHFYICFGKNEITEKIFKNINTFFLDQHDNDNEALLMFKSDQQELIKQWYIVLNYLVEIRKKKLEKKEEEEKKEEKKNNEEKENGEKQEVTDKK